MAADQVMVVVDTMSGKRVAELSFGLTNPISELRAQVSELTGSSDFELVWGSRFLVDEDRLADLEPLPEDPIQLNFVEVQVSQCGLELWLDAASGNWQQDHSRNSRVGILHPPPSFVSDLANGLPAVSFARGEYWKFQEMIAQTVFVVCRLAYEAPTRAGLIGGDGQDLGIRYYDIPDGSDWSKWISSAGNKGHTIEGDQNDFVCPVSEKYGKFEKASGGHFFVNGVETFDVSKGQWHIVSAVRAKPVRGWKATLGGYYSGRDFVGDVAEVLVYSRQLEDSQRKRVEAYLGTKWKIPFGELEINASTA